MPRWPKVDFRVSTAATDDGVRQLTILAWGRVSEEQMQEIARLVRECLDDAYGCDWRKDAID
jgi:hypothetical protein